MAEQGTLDPMQFLQAQYRESLEQRRDLLNGFEGRLQADPNDVVAMTRAREIAHALKGSGATYGFPQLTDIAKKTEKALDQDFLGHLQDLISTISQTIEQCPKLGAAQEAAAGSP